MRTNAFERLGNFLKHWIVKTLVFVTAFGCSLEPKSGNPERNEVPEPEPTGKADAPERDNGELNPPACSLALIEGECQTEAPKPPAVDREAAFLTLLKDNCASCHNRSYPGVRLRDVGSVRELIDSGFIVPTNPEVSILLHRIEGVDAPMPPRPMARFSDANLAFIKAFITQDLKDSGSNRALVKFADESRSVMADLTTINASGVGQARFKRYLSLVGLHNQKSISDVEMKQAINAVSRTINSLSFRPAIVLPELVNEQLLRIDLRDYGWDEADWEFLVSTYPYGGIFSAEQRAIMKTMTDPDPVSEALSGTEVASVRVEWFLANATRPENYHRFLDMPATTQALEQKLGFSILANLDRMMKDNSAKSDVVTRSGFMNSGVSSTNRVMERHSINTGSFWISYDFAPPFAGEDPLEKLRKNIFAAPFGPSLADAPLSFKHDGGEVIFSLPNGLFGYLLVTAAGARLDIAPVAIVSDPARPEGILNGLSCMTCHRAGLIPKEDEVSKTIESRLTGELKLALKRLYAPKGEIYALLDADNVAYLAAVRKASINKEQTSVDIVGLGVRFEREVSIQMAAAELGITDVVLKKLINDSPELSGQLGSLVQGTYNMKRPLFENAVPQLIQLVNSIP
jgi:hypothetical protein